MVVVVVSSPSIKKDGAGNDAAPVGMEECAAAMAVTRRSANHRRVCLRVCVRACVCMCVCVRACNKRTRAVPVRIPNQRVASVNCLFY